jgi:hypothetical protein
MESSVLIAIVTAIASIIVAFIQATTSLRVTRLKEPPVQPSAVPVQPGAPVKTLSANRTWLWVVSILVITNFLWQLYFGDVSAGLFEFGATLWCTCLLAYFRPIRWAYIAGVVTLINAISLAIVYIQAQGWYVDLDLTVVSFFYIANAVLAAGIGYLRQRNAATNELLNESERLPHAKPD